MHSSVSAGKQPIRGGVERTPDGTTRFTFSRNLPPDVTLVIIVLAQGDVQPCEIVDAPSGAPPFGPPPAGGRVHAERGSVQAKG